MFNCIFGKCTEPEGDRTDLDVQQELSNIALHKSAARLKNKLELVSAQRMDEQIHLHQKGLIGQNQKWCVYWASAKKDGENLVVKKLKNRLDPESEKRLLSILQFLSFSGSSHIQKVKSVYIDRYSRYQILIELLAGTTLLQRFTNLPRTMQSLARAKSIFRQVLIAVSQLHNSNIVHGEIRAQHFLFQSNHEQARLVLIDVFLNVLSNKQNISVSHNPFRAPELSTHKPTMASDIWALGIIFFQLMTGRISPGHLDEHLNIEFSKEQSDTIGPIGIQFLKQFLHPQAGKRVSVNEALEHSFLKQNFSCYPLSQSDQVKNYVFYSKTRKTIEYLIMFDSIKKEEFEQLQHLFKAMDTSGDGLITRQEFSNQIFLLQTNLDLAHVILEETEIMMKEQGLQKLRLIEFFRMMQDKWQGIAKKKLKDTFNQIDLDGSGHLNKQEIQSIMKGINLNDISWNKFLKQYDQNSDGMISLEEFVQFIIDLTNLKLD